MIPRGNNGRISALFLVKKLLTEGRVPLSEANFSVNEEGNELLRLAFPEEKKTSGYDPEREELAAAGEELYSTLLTLLYDLEADPELRVTLKEGTGEPQEYRGMRVLILLSTGELKLTEKEGCIHVCVSGRLENAEGIEAFTEHLASRLASFTDDPVLPLVFDTKDAAEETEKPVVLETQRETLLNLQDMFQDLREQAEEAEDLASEELSFREGRIYTGSSFFFAVPDGFLLLKDQDDYEFILYKENEENKEEWEASPFLLLPQERFREENAVKRLLFREDGSSAVFLFDLPLSGGREVQRFRLEIRAYSAERKERFLSAAVRLFETMKAREA